MDATMKARKALISSLQKGSHLVQNHTYVFEVDRWLDLVTVLLSEGAGLMQAEALAIVGHLRAEQVSTAKHRKARAQMRRDFEATIQAQDFDHARMDQMALVMTKLDVAIRKRYPKGLPSFLRSHGDRMVKELSQLLRKSGVSLEQANRIATVWLQNSANMPVLSASDPHIKAFCEKNHVSLAELLSLADDLGLNVAYLDDVLLATETKPSSRRGKDVAKKHSTKQLRHQTKSA
jgi:hypothetical protein